MLGYKEKIIYIDMWIESVISNFNYKIVHQHKVSFTMFWIKQTRASEVLKKITRQFQIRKVRKISVQKRTR